MKLRFIKPRAHHQETFVKGVLVIRYSYVLGGERSPGMYLIDKHLNAYFVPRGMHPWNAELICVAGLGDERPADRYEDSRRRGRFLWTSCAKQRALSKLYRLIRKDWESKLLQQETAK